MRNISIPPPGWEASPSQKFKNIAMFLRLGQPSMLILRENKAFRKRSSNWRNLKAPALHFVWMETFSKRSFSKTFIWRYDDHVISLTEICSNTNAKWPAICCVFKFVRRSVDGKHLMLFQSETSGFKFLRLSVDGGLMWCFLRMQIKGGLWEILGRRLERSCCWSREKK